MNINNKLIIGHFIHKNKTAALFKLALKSGALIGNANDEFMCDILDFSEAYGRLEAEMNRVTGKLDAVDKEKGERGYRERQCRLFLRAISNLVFDDGENAGQGETRCQSDLFLALVDRVVVGDGLTFILRDGTKWER